MDRSSSEPWVIDIEAARQLLHDLGEALDAIEHLEPEVGAGKR